jgi:hypothetical protein
MSDGISKAFVSHISYDLEFLKGNVKEMRFLLATRAFFLASQVLLAVASG